MKEKILFVSQRYGLEVNGGAEAECRMYAERLLPYYDVDVLTTCAQDHVTWKNSYPAGRSTLNGVNVIRVPSDRERSKRFPELCAQVMAPHTDADEKAWLDAQGPYCPDLLQYLKDHAREYKAVLFMTYLYYPTVEGILTDCGTTKILIPTAHDEWPIYLRIFDTVLNAVDKIIYNSEAEKRFVERRFRSAVRRSSVVVGAGVVYPEEELPSLKDRFGIEAPYVCYSGRIESAKGCDTMFRYFQEYKARHPGDLKLVMTGKAAMDIPKSPDILSLGFVSEAEKYAVMQGAQFLIQPSSQESLSIVALESLLMGRPILVNGNCEVLKDHCLLSNAGLYYSSYYEFEACVEYLFSHPREYGQMCANGKDYVRRVYSWDIIIDKIHQLIEE